MNGETRSHPSDTASRRYALWMFDFDNTLAHLEPAVDWAQSRRELQVWLASRGVAETLFEEFPRGNLVLYEAMRARLTAGGAGARAVLPHKRRSPGNTDVDGAQPSDDEIRGLLDGASAIIEKYELMGVPAAPPAHGAVELLSALGQHGAIVAIVTSNSSRTVAGWLQAHCADLLVHRIVGRDARLALKPSPATLEHTMAACEATPADTVFVGDSEADLRAARAAGVHFYGTNATDEGRDRLIALGAREVFSSPAALSIYLNPTVSRAAMDS